MPPYINHPQFYIPIMILGTTSMVFLLNCVYLPSRLQAHLGKITVLCIHPSMCLICLLVVISTAVVRSFSKASAHLIDQEVGNPTILPHPTPSIQEER